ncbi:hypothetical protein [Bordetella holmesii]|uniref:hypothetical protein n=1 Tax=Bordetella holmesii TaxID=35814 RepID=UPI00051907F0|nr:hypothetical protein [Bordetella holmesii]
MILDFSRIKAGIMLDRKTIERLGGWEGYRVERVVWPEGESRTVTMSTLTGLKRTARQGV